VSRKKVEIRLQDGSTRIADLGPDVDLEAEDIRYSAGERVTKESTEAVVKGQHRLPPRP